MMIPLLCLSPILLDQSFPRTEDELQTAAIALGSLQELLENKRGILINTATFADFVEYKSIEWENPVGYPELNEIHRLLTLFYLQPSAQIIQLATELMEPPYPHPIPSHCDSNTGLIEFWQDEMGRILAIHDEAEPQAFFIGVACAYGFAGDETDTYHNPDERRVLPLVGQDLAPLIDAFEWETSRDALNKRVQPADVKRNYKAIGATEVKESGSNHYLMVFPNARNVTFGKNREFLDSHFFTELSEITNYDSEVIRHALVIGELPPRPLKIQNYVR